MALESRLVTDKERTLFRIGVTVSAIFWIVVVVTLVGLMVGLMLAPYILAAHAMFVAYLKGNSLKVSPTQLPELHAKCAAAAQKLGLPFMPVVYVQQSHGIVNAFATRILSRDFVIINSALIDACNDPRELDFVVGHEIGHLAAGHLRWNFFLLPFHLVPWLGAAYSRAREYTCDRCGFAVVEDLEPALRALVVLASGGKMAASVDLEVFAEQRLESGRFWMGVLELNLSHPYTCKRVAALQEFDKPGTVREVPRSAFAYPFAPLFAAAAIGGRGGSGIGALVLFILVFGGLLASKQVLNETGKKHGLSEATQMEDHEKLTQLLKLIEDAEQSQDEEEEVVPPPPEPPRARPRARPTH